MIKRLNRLFEKNFKNHKEPVTKLSYDSDNRESLCYSDAKFYNYDALMRYAKTNKTDDTLSSPDAIHFQNRRIMFIEFKNGFISSSVRKGLKLKGIEGGFISLYKIAQQFDRSITFEQIFDVPKTYVIVYNSRKNKLDKKPKGKRRRSSSRINSIRTHLENMQLKFGLEKYQGTFFERIEIVSERVFVKKVVPQLTQEGEI